MGAAGAGTAASVAHAMARAAGRPVLVEALLDGAAVQVHRDGERITISGDVPDPEAVTDAVRSIEAASVVVDAVVDAAGVRFTDLLLLDGESWVARPTRERLTVLAERTPVAFMVERTLVEEPAWAEAFAAHVRERGLPGVVVRLADAAYGAEGERVVVRF